MPPWHTRLHVGSPSSKPTSAGKSTYSKDLPQRSQLVEGSLADAPLHGVPLLFSPDATSSHARQTSQHSRSHSHPFPTFSGANGPSNQYQYVEHDEACTVNTNGDGFDVSNIFLQKQPSPNGDRDLMTGRCGTCDSLVRWPRHLDVFRCTVCLMVNDLKPVEASTEARRLSESQSGYRESAAESSFEKLPSISTERTRHIIGECLDRFLDLEASSGNGENLHTRRSLHKVDDRLDSPIPSFSQAIDIAFDNTNGTSPDKRLQSSSPLGITADGDGLRQLPMRYAQDGSKHAFRELEKYIAAGFNDSECLNNSFLTSRPPPPVRAASESTIIEPKVANLSGDTQESGPCPELDAKTLLLGDFAENGTWWAGRSPTLEMIRPQTAKGPVETFDDRFNAKSARISWSEVYEWYNIIGNLQSAWKMKVQQFQSVQDTDGRFCNFSQQQLQLMNDSVAESRNRIQRTLLKATESLLRRPGRPVKQAGDCRFLLILLANPLLSSKEDLSPSGTSPGMPNKTPNVLNHKNAPKTLVAIQTSSRSKSTVNPSGKFLRHSGIVKRILGLIANLPSDCHRHLVNWFSRLTDHQLRKHVELVGSFVTYRLFRVTGRKRSSSDDPTAGGLIPSISGPGGGTSAQLHAAIGISDAKKQDATQSSNPYSDDWQTKAAAKVMSLLFFANNNDPIRWPDLYHKASSSSGRARTGSLPQKKAYRHGQALHTSTFYNTMLDYSDLIADFETWETRRGKFSFCQYPMFLSIWAKIHILEYDARRQMEIKAREAFFNSIMGRKAINQYLVLKVRRDCLVEDSLRGVSEVVGSGQEEIKKGLRIEFLGEEGLDSGGLRKEWFLLLVREVFDPEHGLFVYDEDSRYCYFNPQSFETSDQFFLVGALLGLAIYNSTILDVALPPFLFRKLLASAPTHTGPSTVSSRPVHNCSLEDLAEYRPILARGFRKLLEYDGDVESTFLRDFVAVAERYGQVQHVPLCPNGEHRPVTNNNRREYVDLYVRYLLDMSVARQYGPFKRGFFTVCGGNALSLFRPEEIELLVRGSDEPLDVAILSAVAIYDGWGAGVQAANELQVKWFWEVFEEAEPKDQRKLLSFITASDRIPAMGATSLVIKIVCLGNHINRYPIARTCFNMIGLHRYRSRETLRSMLWRAVYEGEGFGMK